ncbi:DUF2079 domain-containing protein [Streptomyces sp. NPDC090025]|uniref:DUF2079 domain-containing protein n=1 Tax=Streptomyces sp. NPDC090025 TaxID=3365922 RepID=UPI003834A4EF
MLDVQNGSAAEPAVPRAGSGSSGPAGENGENSPAGVPAGAGSAAPAAPVLPYALLAGVFGLLYFLYSWVQYERFRSPSWDLGIFEQAVRAYAELRAPIVDIKGPGFLILGDHFSPVTALLAPLYWVWSSPLALLFAQAALFAASAAVVGRTAQQVLGSRALGIALTVAYGLSWGLQEAVKSDFHEIAFAVPLLALTCRALLLGRWTAAVAWALPLVLVKEDMGLTVAMVGAVLFVKGQKRLGAAVAGFGVAAFALTVLVLIPAASRVGQYDYWAKIEKGGDGAEVSFLDSVLGAFQHGEKWEMVLFVLGVAGFLCLRSPLTLLILPTLAWRFLSHDANHWGLFWHYNAILMPVVFLALVDAVRAVRSSPRPWLAAYGRVAIPVVTAIAAVHALDMPLRELTRPATYTVDARTLDARRAVAAVPAGTSVETNVTLMAHLTADHTVYWVGGAPGVSPDYLALDLSSGWSQPVADPVGLAAQLHPEARYEVAVQAGQFVVLKRQ